MKDRTIGLFLLARQNEYQRLQEASAIAMAHHLKTPLDVHFSESNAYVQTKQIYDFVHEHPTGSVLKADRLKVIMGRGGLSTCGNAQNCAKVCPKEIPLTESIGATGRSMTYQSIKRWFTDK